MLALMQPDQLLATVLELDPTLAEQMDNAQRHTLACELCNLLQREGIESHAIRITALQTLLRSGAWLLAEPGFAQVLRDAQTRGDSAMISDWVAGVSNTDSERGIT